MGEEGLVAIHKILNNINNQDERIWRQTAVKKCLKKETEKIEEQTKRYELQIATLKKDPLHKKKEEITQSLEDNVRDQLQTHKLLCLTLNAKNEEIERKTKDIESWDKKYKDVIVELKEAYDIKKTLYESINPMYKKLTEINAAEKVAEVRLKQLKASSERRQRSQKQLEIIKKDIFHKTILNFANAVIRKKKYDEVNSKLKVLAEKKKDMVRDMFEAQEALKKLRVSHTRISSEMFTGRIPKLNMQPGMTNKNGKRRIPDFMLEFNNIKRLSVDHKDPNHLDNSKTSNDSNLEEDIQQIPLHTPKKKPLLSSNRINILSNKTIALPPLRTILAKHSSRLDTSNRSFGDISFNRSQNSQINSQTESVLKLDSTLKSSQVQVEKNQNLQNTPKVNENREEPLANIVNIIKPSDYLKTLKFTTQSNKLDALNKSSSFSCENSQTNQTQKASILKSQVCKRKLNESVQDVVDSDTSQRKKEKNVNFASPIQQQIEINQLFSPDTGSSNLSSPKMIPSNRDMNSSLEGNMWMSTSDQNDGEFQMDRPVFSFTESNETPPDKNAANISQASMFGVTNNAAPSFEFCFGGSSKASGGLWDLFG